MYTHVCVYRHLRVYGRIPHACFHTSTQVAVPRLFMTKGPAAEPTRPTDTLLEHVSDNHTNVFLRNSQRSLAKFEKSFHILQYNFL